MWRRSTPVPGWWSPVLWKHSAASKSNLASCAPVFESDTNAPVSIAKCRSFASGESRDGGRKQRTTSMRWSSKHRSMILAPSSPRQQDENVISELQKLPREELIRKLVQEQDRRMLAQVSLASMGALAPPGSTRLGIDSPHAARNTSPLCPGAPFSAKCHCHIM